MDAVSDGCRLCLDRFAESFTTIDNPLLSVQMGKVFCFTIVPKPGYSSDVCQSCSYAISEFFQFSEKVRQNQKLLDGNLKISASTLDSEITIESVKVESFSDVGPLETTEGACQPKTEYSEDGAFQADSDGDDESYEPPSGDSQTKRKRQPGKGKGIKPRKTRQQREEEDKIFNKHFSMVCDLCGTSTATFSDLVIHFKKKHNRREGYVVCCNKKLFKRYAILDHIDFHTNPDAFRCELCGNNYKNKDILHMHMITQHPSAGQFECDLCSQSFALKSALAQHLKRHEKVKCPKCNNTFACKGSLNYHMTNQHGDNDRAMVCDICGKEFLAKLSFERHMDEHKGIAVQRFQCEICQRWLKGERGLRNHINWVHNSGVRKLQCDICLQKYPHSRALYLHKLQTHAEPKHECEFCGRKFKKAISLKEHRTIHTGEVLYNCKYCGIPQNCMVNMYRHIKREHPTEWAQKKLKESQESSP